MDHSWTANFVHLGAVQEVYHKIPSQISVEVPSHYYMELEGTLDAIRRCVVELLFEGNYLLIRLE